MIRLLVRLLSIAGRRGVAHQPSKALANRCIRQKNCRRVTDGDVFAHQWIAVKAAEPERWIRKRLLTYWTKFHRGFYETKRSRLTFHDHRPTNLEIRVCSQTI